MLTSQKVEWLEFIATNVTYLGSNIYPEFSDIDRTADTLAVVEIFVLNGERMITGTMYTGYARITFVAPDPKTLDHELLDAFGDALETKYNQFTTMQVSGVKNVSEPKQYTPEKENILKREVDIGMTWYIGT